MPPFLGKTQAPIPADRRGGGGDTKDRNHFLIHAGMVSRAWDKQSARSHGYHLSPLATTRVFASSPPLPNISWL